MEKKTHWGLAKSEIIPLNKEDIHWVAGFVDGDVPFTLLCIKLETINMVIK